jgi:DNA-binding HxlR family transcriptional regulator
MRSNSFDGMVCSIAGVLDAVGDRWAMLILRDLGLGLARYEDLRKSTGITTTTLSDRLRHLEGNELIERRRYQTRPDRYEYVLTRRGMDMVPVIQVLAQVGDSWKIASEVGPPLRFIDRRTGRVVKVVVVDAMSGQVVPLRDVQPEAGPGADDLVRWRLKMFESAGCGM